MKQLIILGLSLVLYQANAQPGALDASFGNNGKVILNIANYKNSAYGLAIQSDGKFVIEGNAAGAFTIARCNPDGTLDMSFAGKGYDTVQTILGSANSVIIQPDGKIVAVGEDLISNTNTTPDFATVRYNSDGQRDYTFNTNGIAITNGFGTDWGYAAAIQPDGKLLAGGSSGTMTLLRYNPDGSLDQTFSSSGKLRLGGFSYNGSVRKIIVQPDNNILVIGYAIPPNSTNSQFVLMRLNPDGSFDSSFGANGVVTTDFFGTYNHANEAALLADGKIIVSGFTLQQGSGDNFAIAKYNADGSLDNSFGNGGKVVQDLGGTDAAYGMAIDTEGRIILAGNSDTLCALVRFLPDGTLDTDFGTGGISRFAVAGIDDRLQAIALQPDGKIVGVGRSETGNYTPRAIIVRVLNNGGVYTPGIPVKQNDIDLFPNPANKMVYFKNTTDKKICTVKIVAANGQLVHQANGADIRQVQLDDIPPGSYFFRLYLEDNKVLNKPVIIHDK